MKKHTHYDCIIAWAEGKEIEYLNADNYWIETSTPGWSELSKYRIKPLTWTPKRGRYVLGFDHYTPGIQRDTEELTNKARVEIKKYLLLLAYRDEFDPDFVYNRTNDNAYVYQQLPQHTWHVGADESCPDLGKVYMSRSVANELVHKLTAGEVVI